MPAGLFKTTQGFCTYETVDDLTMDDVTDDFDEPNVIKDIGLGITPAAGLPPSPLNFSTMPGADSRPLQQSPHPELRIRK